MQPMQMRSNADLEAEGSSICTKLYSGPVIGAFCMLAVILVSASAIVLSQSDMAASQNPATVDKPVVTPIAASQNIVNLGGDKFAGCFIYSEAGCKLATGCTYVQGACVSVGSGAAPPVVASSGSDRDVTSPTAGPAPAAGSAVAETVASPDKVPPMSLPPQLNLAAARTKVEEYRTMLESYYSQHKAGSAGPLLGALHLKPGDTLYEQGVDFLAQKFARAILHQDAFNIGVLGSSVAAGHDNCNYDSYERQLERSLGPVLASFGVKFNVRNAGERGECGDNYANQIWCVRNMVGDDVDILHYTWTYFEAGNSDQWAAKESLLRWGLLMDRAPALHVMNAGGGPGQSFDDCGHTMAQDPKFFEKYGKYGANVLCLETGIFQNGKFAGSKWGAVGDGVHKTTRYGESEAKPRKDSLGVVFRNWHPGPLGYQIVADGFGYYYSQAILKAIEMLTDEVAKGAAADLSQRWPKVPKLLLQSELPKPISCDPRDCANADVDQPPGQFNCNTTHLEITG